MSVNGLEVTDVVIFPVKNKAKDSTIVAFARIVLNDQFVISGVRINEGKNGPFITWPKEYNKIDGRGYDIIFPITAKLRVYLSNQILNQYVVLMDSGKQSGKDWESAPDDE